MSHPILFDPLLHTGTVPFSSESPHVESTESDTQPMETIASKLAFSLLANRDSVPLSSVSHDLGGSDTGTWNQGKMRVENIFGDDDDPVFEELKVKKAIAEADRKMKEGQLKQEQEAWKEKIAKEKKLKVEAEREKLNKLASEQAIRIESTGHIKAEGEKNRDIEAGKEQIIEKSIFGDEADTKFLPETIFSSTATKTYVKPAGLFSSPSKHVRVQNEERGLEGLYLPTGAVEYNTQKIVTKKDVALFDVDDDQFSKFEQNLLLKPTVDTDQFVKKIAETNDDDVLHSFENTILDSIDISQINVDENFDLEAYLKQQSISNKLFD